MEDIIGLKILNAKQDPNIMHDVCRDILQDYYDMLNIDQWETNKSMKSPSVLQQLCTAAKKYRHFLSSNYYFPLLKSNSLLKIIKEYFSLEISIISHF